MRVNKLKKNKKSAKIQIPLEPKVKDQIQTLAKLEGITPAAFSRRAILEDLNQRLKPPKVGVQNVK